MLYDTLEVLLNKISSPHLVSPILEHMADAVLMIMRKLREQKYQQYASILQESDADDLAAGRYLPVNQLHSLLRGILNGILRSDSNSVVRGNLYIALLNYLQFTHRPFLHMIQETDIPVGEDIRHPVHQESYRVWYADEIHAQWTKLEQGNESLLVGVGDKLLLLISDDATGNQAVWRATSFALLDWLMKYDIDNHWLKKIIIGGGILRNFLNDFRRQDKYLLSIFTGGPEAIDELVCY
jgi:nuclear pore complex protein Nup205